MNAVIVHVVMLSPRCCQEAPINANRCPLQPERDNNVKQLPEKNTDRENADGLQRKEIIEGEKVLLMALCTQK